MDLTPTPEEEAFRNELRSWLAENLPESAKDDDISDDVDELQRLREWQRKLAEGRWLGLTWPEEYGGRGLTPIEQSIFDEEMAMAGAPPVVGMIGIGIIGPTILAVGTEKQKEQIIERMLRGDDIWAAGFSEPNAGSDLGSMSTRAVLDGDHFVVNGQKTWTSGAQYSDLIFLLARTNPDAPRFAGISSLVVDMKSEGISVRPLRQITGEAEFNEVFFTDVRVPVENLVGELHGGWQVLMTALMNERTNLGGGMFVAMVRLLEKVVESARERGIADDPRVRQKIAQNWIELEVFKNVSACALSRVSQGRPGPESAILKMFWSEADQRLANTAMEVLGPYGQLTGDETALFAYHYLRARGRTIEAGTSEVMRNTIATRVLGLPKSF